MREDQKLSLFQNMTFAYAWLRIMLPCMLTFLMSIPTSFGGTFAAPTGTSKASQVTSEATCGLACQYHKANDNITIQVLYLINKVKQIEIEEDEAKIRTATGAICKNVGDVVDCKNRYKAFQAFALLQLRQSLGRNEDTLAKLTHGRQADGTVNGSFIGFATNEKTEPYTPDVPTLAELQKQFEAGKSNKKQISQKDLKKWSEELILSNPKAGLIEFRKKSVEGNPHSADKKSGYQLTMEQKDKAGKSIPISKREEKIYDRALKEVEKVRDQLTDRNADPNDGTVVISPKEVLGKGDGKESADEISYKAYTDARSLVIDKVNQDSKKELTERKPAQKPEKKAEKQSDGKVLAKSEKDAGKDSKDAESPSSEKPTEKGVAVKKEFVQRRIAKDDEKIAQPENIKNSRYIRYDVKDMMDSIEETTEPTP